jgi:hypothetical protein
MAVAWGCIGKEYTELYLHSLYAFMTMYRVFTSPLQFWHCNVNSEFKSSWQADCVRACVSVCVCLSVYHANLWRHSEYRPEVLYSCTAFKLEFFLIKWEITLQKSNESPWCCVGNLCGAVRSSYPPTCSIIIVNCTSSRQVQPSNGTRVRLTQGTVPRQTALFSTPTWPK